MTPLISGGGEGGREKTDSKSPRNEVNKKTHTHIHF